jgi:demethylmenaquinone methyltransferase/2-methoxy-6-polyprenyl-1,4-benzoquinol methylase
MKQRVSAPDACEHAERPAVHAPLDWIANLHRSPDAALALARYARMASTYDSTCHRIEPLRALAIQSLALRPGETVIDVACGTGVTTEVLARMVGPGGRVVGIELSPSMAARAAQRLGNAGMDHARIEVAAVERATLAEQADAFLFSFTHDVLQQSDAIEALRRMAKSGARYAVLGMRTLPWLWGWPVNLFVMWRARRYLTTFHGLAAPWALLEAASREFRLVGCWHAGTSYLATGTLATPGEPT